MGVRIDCYENKRNDIEEFFLHQKAFSKSLIANVNKLRLACKSQLIGYVEKFII